MLNTYFLLFIIYSFIGWLGEIALSIIVNKKFVDRGFLMGPWCPIYGCGCLLLIILLSKYNNEPFALFALAMIICSILEYLTSWILEVIFKMHWWDYSNEKFNINGRICLEYMVPFGIVGVLVVKYINPIILNLLCKIPSTIFNILTVILAGIFIIDLIISSNIMFNLKSFVTDSKKDSTEDIKKQIKKNVKEYKLLYTRLINAFPNFKKIVHNPIKKKKNKKSKK